MAADRIQVSYSKKVSQQVGDGKYETLSLGGSIEFDNDQSQEWQDSYEGAYVAFKLIVDQLLDEAAPKPQVATTVAAPAVAEPHVPRTLPGERITPQPQAAVSQQPEATPMEQPVENGRASFTGCRVFNVEIRPTSRGGEWAKVRIGNRDQIPGQYTTVKSFEPQIVSKLKGLREGDFINVAGYWNGWQGNEDREIPKFDLMATLVEKVVQVHA